MAASISADEQATLFLAGLQGIKQLQRRGESAGTRRNSTWIGHSQRGCARTMKRKVKPRSLYSHNFEFGWNIKENFYWQKITDTPLPAIPSSGLNSDDAVCLRGEKNRHEDYVLSQLISV